MKDLIILTPKLDGDYSDSIVQTVEPFKLTKKHFVTVPIQFTATVVVDNTFELKIGPCSELNLFKYVKKTGGYKGAGDASIQLYFVLNKSFDAVKWGFGDIPVNNKRIQDAYHIGARGTCSFSIESYKNLILSFNMMKNITSDMIRDRIINIIKTVGIGILSTYFTNSEISHFEINSLNSEIREKMLEALKKEKAIVELGIKIKALTLEPIFVREDDEERIGARINNKEAE